MTTSGQLAGLVRNFNAERNWLRFHNPRQLATSVAIEAAELMECFQWLTDDQSADICSSAEVAGEIADVAIYLLALCDVCGIDLSQAVINKLETNRKRFPPPKDQP